MLGIPPLATNDCHYVHQVPGSTNTRRCCAFRPARPSTTRPGSSSTADGYYLKSAAEMRAHLGRGGAGACRQHAADRRARRVLRRRLRSTSDRLPIFPVPEGYDQGSWLREEVATGLRAPLPGRPAAGVPRQRRVRDRRHHRRRASRPTSWSSATSSTTRARSASASARAAVPPPARWSPTRWASPTSTRSRTQPAVRAVPESRARRRCPISTSTSTTAARRDDPLRHREVRRGQGRPGHHVRHHQDQGRDQGFRARAARAAGFAIADQITKALPPPIMAKDISVSGITDHKHERYGEAAEVRALVESDPESRERSTRPPSGLEGLIRNAGVHACAVIMSCDPLTDAIPLWKRAQDGAIITGWDYPSCEAIGLLKMDFLGLRNLTVHRRRDRQHEAEPRHRHRPRRPAAGRQGHLRTARSAATRSACSSSTAAPCGICCAACSPPPSTTSSRSARCTAPARWA